MSKKPEMTDIETAAAEFAAANAEMARLVGEAGEAIGTIRHKYSTPLKDAYAAVKMKRKALERLIDRRRDLFVRPRTRILHGIRLGVTKDRGAVHYDCDEDVMVARIRATLGDKAEDLIAITEKPIKKQLALQDEKVLRKLGVEVREDTDSVLIKPAANDVEKAAQAFLEGEKS